jgi:orotidine-5'-phosphate decarboxylase
MTFGQRFEDRARASQFPICLGLDPRIDDMPRSIIEAARQQGSQDAAITYAVVRFHELAIAAVADLVPAVKLQLAFYEQYGVAGMVALRETISIAHRNKLLVIADGKRNDIGSTAAAYARAFLGGASAFGELIPAFNADAVTVNPWLGRDSITPFVETARKYDRGVFLLLHTSNPSAVEFQEARVNGEPLFLMISRLADELGEELPSEGRFSSVGGIVGCTFPEAATIIRSAVPSTPIIVVGYGAQAGGLDGCTACFTEQGDGALVNASRSLTYSWPAQIRDEEDIVSTIRERVLRMGNELARGCRAARPEPWSERQF